MRLAVVPNPSTRPEGSLGDRTGYTRCLDAEEAEAWHVAIIAAAPAHLTSDTSHRRGAWCNRCPYFGPCQIMDLDALGKWSSRLDAVAAAEKSAHRISPGS